MKANLRPLAIKGGGTAPLDTAKALASAASAIRWIGRFRGKQNTNRKEQHQHRHPCCS